MHICICNFARPLCTFGIWKRGVSMQAVAVARIMKMISNTGMARVRSNTHILGMFNSSACQEGVGSITFGRHVSNRLNFMYSESWGRLVYILVESGRGGVGGSPDVVIVFLGGGSSFFLGHSHGIIKYY